MSPIRKELGIRTVFNLLGPLCNPVQVDVQLIGVFDKNFVKPIAEVLKNIGCKRALVVHGEDGLDEITLTGSTYYAEIKDQWIRTGHMHPRDFGLEPCRPEDLLGGGLETNKQIANRILNGEAGPQTDVVCLNAGAVLYLAGKCGSIKEGISAAREIITSGKAKAKISALRRYYPVP